MDLYFENKPQIATKPVKTKSPLSQPIILQQKSRWLPADMETPISIYKSLVAQNHGILLESAEVDGRWGRYSILACDFALIVSCLDGKLHLDIFDQRLQALAVLEKHPFQSGLKELLATLSILPPENEKLPAITRALYGWLGFGLATIFNPKLNSIMPLEEAEATLVLPSTVLMFDHVYNRLCQISLNEHKEAALMARNLEVAEAVQKYEIKANPDEAGYMANVEKIKAMLGQGDAIQVVPSVRFSTAFSGDTFNLYRRMRRINASPYMFYMNLPKITLFGSSPEAMVRCTDGLLELSPIAGTRKRSKDELKDAQLAAELRADPKEQAEHVMLVDLGRNDLGRIARTGSVAIARYMDIERFSHVMHLTSRITARLEQDLDAVDVLAATFPAGTVSGAPKIRAMEIIRSLENSSRGPYAGCIGWIGLDQNSVNLDMGITIRSMWHKEGMLNWQAGGGIVHDSDPKLEWKEVCNKSAIMRLVLEGEEMSNVSINR